MNQVVERIRAYDDTSRGTPPPSFMDELRTPARATDRLTVRHLEARDQALSAIERSLAATQRLEALERGEDGEPIRSPRFKDVQQIATELRNLRDRLDRTYV